MIRRLFYSFYPAAIVLALLWLLCHNVTAHGAPPSPRVVAALAMTFGPARVCDCAGPNDCSCPPGTCVCPGCVAAKKAGPKQGDRKPADDGGADWTWEQSEGGYWWRYAPARYRPVQVISGGGICGPGG